MPSAVHPISTRHAGREIQFDQRLLHGPVNSIAKFCVSTEPVDNVTQLRCNLSEHNDLLLWSESVGEALDVAFAHQWRAMS